MMKKKAKLVPNPKCATSDIDKSSRRIDPGSVNKFARRIAWNLNDFTNLSAHATT